MDPRDRKPEKPVGSRRVALLEGGKEINVTGIRNTTEVGGEFCKRNALL